jgi:hypothetical protein
MKCPACNKHIVGVVNMKRHLVRCEKYQRTQFNNRLNLAVKQGNIDDAMKVLGGENE